MSGYLKKLFVGVIAVVLLLLAAEGVARLFFSPTDYLWRRLVPDETLRHRVEPHSRGHDAWGFRNRTVPSKADIVALGDSQTYGTSSLARHAWPKLLGKSVGKEVYNMSIGGGLNNSRKYESLVESEKRRGTSNYTPGTTAAI